MTQHVSTEDQQSFTEGMERKQGLPNCLHLIIQVPFYSLLYHTLSLCVHIMHKLIQCKDPISLKRMLRLEVLSGSSPLFWTYFIPHSHKALLTKQYGSPNITRQWKSWVVMTDWVSLLLFANFWAGKWIKWFGRRGVSGGKGIRTGASIYS